MEERSASQQVTQLAAETGVHVRTVWRWWYREGVSAATQYALDAAGERLGIEQPPGGESAVPDTDPAPESEGAR